MKLKTSLPAVFLDSRLPVTIPAGTRMERLYALADQDGWREGSAYKTAGGRELAVEMPDAEVAACCEIED